MDQKTSLRFQLISAWCGPAFLVTFVLFWGVIGHNLPNPSPALSATDLAARYSQQPRGDSSWLHRLPHHRLFVHAVVFVYQRPDGEDRGRVPGPG